MSKAVEDIIDELYKVAAKLLHKGDEETALQIASLIGKLGEVLKK